MGVPGRVELATSWLRRLRFRSSTQVPERAADGTDPAELLVHDPTLRDALAALPDGQRGVVALRLLHEMSTREVVAVIGLVFGLRPLGTADVVQPPPTAPGVDPLEGADLSGVSEAQEAEISDRVVTAEEYLAAFHRHRECLSAAGFELSNQELDHLEHTPDVPPVTDAVPPEALEDGADRECYDPEFRYVDTLWQTSGDQDAIDPTRASRECLRERGIEPGDTDDEIHGQPREAGIGPAECLVEHQ